MDVVKKEQFAQVPENAQEEKKFAIKANVKNQPFHVHALQE